ncbi:uncharacterized protein LOC134542500 isoform X2 [Bacillus rossius redtenbacheri]|uniref:uncharacterized protein LOC134542500 isoform X2 n=1 Tax=Bacillus rossius redtenbacheri TaxID=93214 RepID=UPI002FDF0310
MLHLHKHILVYVSWMISVTNEPMETEAGCALLAQDEEQFYKEGPLFHQADNKSLDFSAVRDGSHITVGSSSMDASISQKQNRKLSIGQFFSLRTEKIQDPGFQPFEDTKQNHCRAEALADLTGKSDINREDDIMNSLVSSTVSSVLPSTSKIQDILSQCGNSLSGTVIVDKMMKGYQRKQRETSSKVLQDKSNLSSPTAAMNKPLSSRRALALSQNEGTVVEKVADTDDENLDIIYQRIRSSQRKSEQRKREGQTKNARCAAKLRTGAHESTGDFLTGSDPSDVDDSVVCTSESRPLAKPAQASGSSGSAGEQRRKRDVARWVAQTSGERVDAGSEVRSRLNETTFLEPADPCLLGSTTVDGAEGGWVSIQPSGATEFVLAVGVLSPVLLKLRAGGGRRLACRVVYEGAEAVDDPGRPAPVDVELLDSQITVGPEAEKELQAWICPKEAIRLRITTKVNLKDVSTNETHVMHYSFLVCGEVPKVLLGLDENSEPGKIEFGLLPENCGASRNVSLENRSDVYLALALALEQKEIKVNGKSHLAFSLSEHGSTERHSQLQVFLREKLDLKSYVQVTVHFHPPPFGSGEAESAAHSAQLVVRFDVPNTQVVLKRLPVSGRSCRVRLSARQKPVALVVPRRGAAAQKTVNVVRNLGTESVRLKFWLDGVDREALRVRPEVLELGAGQLGQVTVVCDPAAVAAAETAVAGFLKLQVVPGGQQHSVPLKCCLQATDTTKSSLGECIVISRPSSRSSDSCENSRESGDVELPRSHSQSSVSGGKAQAPPLKLEALHPVLSFQSLGVGHTLKVSTTIRNYATHSYKLRLTISSEGGDFKMINDNGEAVLSRVLKLHAMECKVLKFQFTATQLGAAVGTVVHHQLAPVNSATHKKIVLCGYGGSAKMILRNISRDASDKMWLSLGEVTNPGQTLVRDIVVENRGTIPGFLVLSVLFEGSRTLYDHTALTISPAAVVVQPRHSETVRVGYRLGRGECASLARSSKAVCEVAILSMVLGDEPTRQRLRRLVEDEGDCRAPDVELLSKVCSTFEKEVPIPDIANLKDSKDARKRFCESFTSHVASVTVESCKDSTLARLGEDTLGDTDRSDTTRMFASLLQDSAFPQPRGSAPEHGSVPTVWDVQPREVALRLPGVSGAVLAVENHHAVPLLCEVASTDDWLQVEPREGIVPPHGSLRLCLAAPCWPTRADRHEVLKANVVVYTENDCITVKVVARFTEPRPPVQLQVTSTPLLGHSRLWPAVDPLVLERHELALPPTPVGRVSSAALTCKNTSDSEIQVDVSASQPFFVLDARRAVPGQTSWAVQVYFSPARPGLAHGSALLSTARHKQAVLLVGKGVG